MLSACFSCNGRFASFFVGLICVGLVNCAINYLGLKIS